MANVVLPYPDLDFVPLDLATAADQNNQEANINYLAQFCGSLATGANLNDGIIQPRHIDFTDITPRALTLTGDGTATSYTAMSGSVSVTVPPSGNLSIIVSARLYNSTQYDKQMYVAPVLSGANTLAASDSNATVVKIISGNIDGWITRVVNLSGLNPGTTTVAGAYKTTGGNMQINGCQFLIIPLW
jgi:hypothetical protein